MARKTRFGEINKEKRNLIIGIVVLLLIVWFAKSRSSFGSTAPSGGDTVILPFKNNPTIIPYAGFLTVQINGIGGTMQNSFLVGNPKNPKTYQIPWSGSITKTIPVNGGDIFQAKIPYVGEKQPQIILSLKKA